jgi:hypothetical protein
MVNTMSCDLPLELGSAPSSIADTGKFWKILGY